jgi:hypothetical protein
MDSPSNANQPNYDANSSASNNNNNNNNNNNKLNNNEQRTRVHIPIFDVDDLAFKNRHDPNFIASISE